MSKPIKFSKNEILDHIKDKKERHDFFYKIMLTNDLNNIKKIYEDNITGLNLNIWNGFLFRNACLKCNLNIVKYIYDVLEKSYTNMLQILKSGQEIRRCKSITLKSLYDSNIHHKHKDKYLDFINSKTITQNDYLPFRFACQSGNLDVVKWFLQKDEKIIMKIKNREERDKELVKYKITWYGPYYSIFRYTIIGKNRHILNIICQEYTKLDPKYMKCPQFFRMVNLIYSKLLNTNELELKSMLKSNYDIIDS